MDASATQNCINNNNVLSPVESTMPCHLTVLFLLLLLSFLKIQRENCLHDVEHCPHLLDNCTKNWRSAPRVLIVEMQSFHKFYFNSKQLLLGRVMAQVVSRRPFTVEARVRVGANPCGICGGQSGTGTGFFCEFFGFPLSISFHRRSPNSYHLGNA
jgi:hypothetical protein